MSNDDILKKGATDVNYSQQRLLQYLLSLYQEYEYVFPTNVPYCEHFLFCAVISSEYENLRLPYECAIL